ncbi:MAG: phasin family protein [Xanthomonadales bacterium]|nr:phasin family protein [Xanthomonadales bacterium]
MTTYTQRIGRAATQVNETAREIWLAGLGAFARAQDEGNKLFDMLVKEGTQLEKETKKDIDKRVVNLRSAVEARVEKVRDTANSNVQKFERVFEDRVARVLARLGVPTADDIQALSKRVQALSKEVKALNEGSTKARTTKKAA